MNVYFYEAAAAEFGDAVDYYDQQLPGLGRRFRQAVVEALNRIQQFPEAYSPMSDRTRRCLVNRFPYGVIYRHDGNTITVVAVPHLHQRPGYWKPRV